MDEKTAAALAALERVDRYRPLYMDEGGINSEAIIDLVTDLLHLARVSDIEPDYIIATAQMHFDAEVREQHEAEKDQFRKEYLADDFQKEFEP